MNVVHENVHPLPIGLANSMWTHGNPIVHKEIFEKHVDKTKEIYFNFNISTNVAKRTECFNAIKPLGITWSNNLPYKEYLMELKRHKFAICPDGNGIDTHRFWECLYMNVIPICKKNILAEYYGKFFPIVLLNEWEELDVSKLKHSNVNQQFMDMAHILHNLNLNINVKMNNAFDIVIPVGPNDKCVINEQIQCTKKNIIGHRNIYLISFDPTIIIDGCVTINENVFPFNIDTVRKYHGNSDRNGWYLQQLLKLYASLIIEGILERYLVIDSDTFFLKPTAFIDADNKCLYNYSTEHNKPYFDHMSKLNADMIKVDENKSGICHHMMFEKVYVEEIINKIEKTHNDAFYNVFLKTVTDIEGSGASEYEIYFNYMFKNHSDNVKIRELNWLNVNRLCEAQSHHDYISYHFYSRCAQPTPVHDPPHQTTNPFSAKTNGHVLNAINIKSNINSNMKMHFR